MSVTVLIQSYLAVDGTEEAQAVLGEIGRLCGICRVESGRHQLTHYAAVHHHGVVEVT